MDNDTSDDSNRLQIFQMPNTESVTLWNSFLASERSTYFSSIDCRKQTTEADNNDHKKIYKKFIKSVVSDWISQGHDVAILTRGIDTKISIYFTTILNMSHIMNDHRPGYISIYAPDEKTFREDHDALWWATMKVTFAASFLQVANVSPNDAIFVDDTAVNVQTMKRAYPSMKCLHAEAGEYVQTFSVLNFII